MKIKVYVKKHTEHNQLLSFGNWIDLHAAETVSIKKGENKLISLGISIKLPKYFQANIVPRSGTYNKYGVIQANHYGVIDGPTKDDDGYSGNNDIWKFNAIALKLTLIEAGDRICQFEIRPAMNAPFWVKLKWLFSNGFKFIEVENLNSKDRGGFGSTGV